MASIWVIDTKDARTVAKYGLFYGCLIPNRYPGIERSIKIILEKLGCSQLFSEMPQATCCPVPGIFYSSDKETWLAIAARNLCIAQDRKQELVTFCNGCFSSFLMATEQLSDPKKLGVINRILKNVLMKYTGIPRVTPEGRRVLDPIKVRHFIDVLYNDIGLESIRSAVVNPLKGLKVAVHYGCHYLRPTERECIEDPVNPIMVDEIVESLGAESVNYENKLDCCGAGGGVRSYVVDLATAISKDKLMNISEVGADLIVTPCPYCLLQLDTVQGRLELTHIPVFHVAQLIALAMGAEPQYLGLEAHEVQADKIISKYGGTK
ncbi:MAG: heterodisulfide reductase-related iron-sulfur binding cluster [Methanomassiliicoccales archaeon]|nr:heterodisulfide reductase-related iron-sulfur binding cluster [Methanomassiliicoccales archaeon]